MRIWAGRGRVGHGSALKGIIPRESNPMKFIPILLVTLASLIWHADAHALSCGDTVTTDTALTADLNCSGGGYALYVATSGVTIDFNGYTVRGTAAMDGVRIANASDVTLLYGNLTGFRTGVNASHADRLTVDSMLMWRMGTAVIASDSRAVTLVGNNAYLLESWAFFLPAYAGSRPSLGGHTIVGNWLEGPSSLIGVCGNANGGSSIRYNELHGGGVQLLDGASDNDVSSNIMEGDDTRDVGIVVFGGRDNLLGDNSIHRFGMGISLIPAYTNSCATGSQSLPLVSGNQVIGNDLSIGQYAIVLGRGDRRNPLVSANRIAGNSIAAFDLGLYLRADSFDNTASGNLFFNTLRAMRDEGAGNSIASSADSIRRPGQSRIAVKPSVPPPIGRAGKFLAGRAHREHATAISVRPGPPSRGTRSQKAPGHQVEGRTRFEKH